MISDYLRPIAAFDFLNISASSPDFDKIDVRKLYKCMRKGKTVKGSSYTKSCLNEKLYSSDKNSYISLHRCARYGISEKLFCTHPFYNNSFYDYNEDENLIIYEYCVEFLKRYTKHKKTKTILNKLQFDHPEIFI